MTAPDQKRRQLLQGIGAGLALPALGVAPAIIAAPRERPQMLDGVQSGDVAGDRALIWSRCDRPGRLIVEWDTRSRFGNPRRMVSSITDAGGLHCPCRSARAARGSVDLLPGSFRGCPQRRAQRALVRPPAQRREAPARHSLRLGR